MISAFDILSFKKTKALIQFWVGSSYWFFLFSGDRLTFRCSIHRYCSLISDCSRCSCFQCHDVGYVDAELKSFNLSLWEFCPPISKQIWRGSYRCELELEHIHRDSLSWAETSGKLCTERLMMTQYFWLRPRQRQDDLLVLPPWIRWRIHVSCFRHKTFSLVWLNAYHDWRQYRVPSDLLASLGVSVWRLRGGKILY